jgi:hypothetical protein
MDVSKLNPELDTTLYRNKLKAPVKEMWKWRDSTWAGVVNAIQQRDSAAELECPVCGERQVYARFVVVGIHLDRSQIEDRPVYIAERWYGCHACQVQLRDWGDIPAWIAAQDVPWESDAVKEKARQRLRREKLAFKI